MKNLFVLAVAGLFATSAGAAEIKWSGSAGWRYSQQKNDDGLNSTTTTPTPKNTSRRIIKSNHMRANLGATGGWENIEWGAGFRTSSGAANDDYTTVNQNLDRTIGLEQAWFRYIRDFGSMDLNLTVGRQKNVLAYDAVSENFFDNDVRWDGLGWQFKFGMFGLNAAQYVTGAKSQGATTATGSSYTRTDATESVASTQGHFNYLLAAQPYMNWKFTDEIEAMFAVGFYKWNDDSKTNATGGGYSGYNSGAFNTPIAPANFNMHNPRQWQFLTAWTLPYNLSLNVEYVMNKASKYSRYSVAGYPQLLVTEPDVSKNAWAASLTYGGLKKAHDFTVGYTYGNKGIASVIGAYANETFLPDNKGHMVSVGYAVADNFNLGWKGVFLEEKERLNTATAAPQTAGLAYTGNNSNQKMKTTYWELTAGVNF